jgi:uncharacterized membrane protein
MSLVHQLASALAPWADYYNASSVAQTVVTFGHFGGMMAAGGFALAADRATLRAARSPATDRSRHLRELAEVHPIVLAALAVTSVSGLLMFAADLESLVVSPAFWAKMGLVALLLLNGWMLLRAGRALQRGDPGDLRGWKTLRVAATTSVILWFAVVLAGSILPNFSS